MPKSFRQIKEMFVAGAKVSGVKTNNPVIVALVGVSGVGNSTIAREFRRHLGWHVIEKNKIRVELREKGLRFTPQNTDEIAYAMLGNILENGGNALLDSDFVEKNKRRKLQKFAQRFRARVLYLRLKCDEDVVLARILHGRYIPRKDIFKNAAIALREHMRRLQWHYRWSEAHGGRYMPRHLGISFFTEIDTAKPGVWNKKVRLAAQKMKRL